MALKIGIQLYSVRESLKKDPFGTLAKGAEAGYKYVDLQYYKDHFNVALVKWLDGCPYSDLKCRYKFHSKALKARIKNSPFARFLPKL